jgi:hypothetical protein
MSEFQITFRGVLPEPNLRALAEAMYQKVKGAYGRASRFHVAIVEQAPVAARPRAISARVQLHAGPHGAHAAAEAWNDNPVAAVREAFAAAYMEMNNARPAVVGSHAYAPDLRSRVAPPASTVAASRLPGQANKLVLFRTRV